MFRIILDNIQVLSGYFFVNTIWISKFVQKNKGLNKTNFFQKGKNMDGTHCIIYEE